MNKLDLSNLNSSRTIAALSVFPGSKILVIGSGNSELVATLVGRACEVWCIESDKSAASETANICQWAVAGDVETLDLREELGESEFDAILMLDALENLRHPADALRALRDHMRPAGVLIASVFNVAHATVKLELLGGRFPYAEGGPLDPEHIRFFDRTGIAQLLESALLTAIDELPVTRPLDNEELKTARERHSDATIDDALADPDALTHQFVVIASAAILGDTAEEPGTRKGLAQQLDRRKRAAEVQLTEAEQRATDAINKGHELERLLSQMADDLSEARLGRAEALHVAELERRHLHASLSIKNDYIADIKRRIEETEVIKLQLTECEGELDELKRVIKASAGYRAADSVNKALTKYPMVHRLARSVARAATRRTR